jgi:hypothetical protein
MLCNAEFGVHMHLCATDRLKPSPQELTISLSEVLNEFYPGPQLIRYQFAVLGTLPFAYSAGSRQSSHLSTEQEARWHKLSDPNDVALLWHVRTVGVPFDSYILRLVRVHVRRFPFAVSDLINSRAD